MPSNNALHFCTLFDKNYLTRGLVTHETLIKAEHFAHLYIFAFDDATLKILLDLNLERATIISLKEFEDKDLLKIKETRTKVEYCWTCTPSIILYAIQKYNLPSCTYIDSDIVFYNSPREIIDEIPNDNSILLTEHRYTAEFDSTNLSGRFCVQFMTFKNTETSISALMWWRERCNEWCFHIAKDGKLGDQGYIQDWVVRFKGVWIMQNIGGGLAPWNIQQYNFITLKDVLTGIELKTGKIFKPIFYHFHYLRFYTNKEITLTDYPLLDSHKIYLYYPYLLLLEKKKRMLIEKFNIDFDPHGSREHIPALTLTTKGNNWRTFLKKLFSI